MTASVVLLQLYPDELGVAGDSGNVLALTTRLERAGISVTVVRHSVGEVLPVDADLVVVGSGPVSAIRTIYSDLLTNREALKSLAASGVPIFAYGAGAELLGTSVTLTDGSTLDGIGIFPFSTARIAEHRVGYALVAGSVGELVGFVDNASLWRLDKGANSLGALTAGIGNSDGLHEGVVVGDSVATQLGGPLLPLNPALTDSLIRAVANRKGFEYSTGDEHAKLDHFAAKAREVMKDNVKHVFSRI